MLTDFLIVVTLTVGALWLLYRYSDRIRGYVDKSAKEDQPLKCKCGKFQMAYENSIKDTEQWRHTIPLCQPKREVIV